MVKISVPLYTFAYMLLDRATLPVLVKSANSEQLVKLIRIKLLNKSFFI